MRGVRCESPELKTRVCELVRQGVPLWRAAQVLGIGRRTVYDWRERSAEFAEDYAGAQAAFLGRCEQVVANAALTDWRAAAWFLERRSPEEWGRNRAVKPSPSPSPSLDEILSSLAH
jgi:hypothetical protein